MSFQNNKTIIGETVLFMMFVGFLALVVGMLSSENNKRLDEKERFETATQECRIYQHDLKLLKECHDHFMTLRSK